MPSGTVRTETQLYDLFYDNLVGAISAQDSRDLIATLFHLASEGDVHFLGEVKPWSPQPGQAVDATSGSPSAAWAVCDGRTVNGLTTPDLTDKFIRGSDVAGANATGGADTHTHTLPANTGGGQANIDDHPSHTHTVNPAVEDTSLPTTTDSHLLQVGATAVDVPSLNHYHTVDISSTTSSGSGDLSHAQTDHSHSITGPTGSGSTVPAHYTLVYLMKVA